MFKSVFAKYLTAFAAIILVSFVTVALIVRSMVTNYASESKEEKVTAVAESARDLMMSDYENVDGQYEFEDYVAESKGRLVEMLNAIGHLDTDKAKSLTVFVTDEVGRVILSVQQSVVSEQVMIGEKIISEIYRDGIYKGKGMLDGILETRHLICAHRLETGGEIIGTVFACSSSAREEALVSVMTETIIMASLWVMLAAMIAVYFISDRIISPLHSMKNAAKEFAKGNFETRVSVRGSDEISELGAAFNNMAQSLEQLETMRNSFLANVSHDLRTPMTTISGFIDGINSGAIPPEKHPYYLGIISSEVHRLSRLVSQLLDISKLESGDRKFTPTPFDICEMARLILISFEQKIDAKRLEVSFDTDKDSMIALADRDAIHQVLYNLCDNAIKFSEEGGAFRIAIRRKEGRKLTVSVYNDGIGIPSEDLPFVFDRFYKTDKSRGLDKNGVGLGLYIVKTILEAQGETISVQSEHERFCEFTFTLTETDNK